MASQPIIGALSIALASALEVPVFVADADASIAGSLVLLVPYDARLFGGTVHAYAEIVQVRVAAATYVASWELAWRCYKELVATTQTPTDASQVLIGPIAAQQPPFLLGHDERDRIVHVFNIVVPVTDVPDDTPEPDVPDDTTEPVDPDQGEPVDPEP